MKTWKGKRVTITGPLSGTGSAIHVPAGSSGVVTYDDGGDQIVVRFEGLDVDHPASGTLRCDLPNEAWCHRFQLELAE